MARQKLLSAGFKAPNYTQVPNDFFTVLPEMEEAELRVTAIMIRQTFGYHRGTFKMGLNKLAEAAGLSRNGAKAGAEAAEARGTFRRVNPDQQGSAEWELVVDHAVIEEWSTSDQAGSQPVTTPPSTSDQQSGIKENIKKQNKSSSTAADVFKLYEGNIGPLTPMIGNALQDAIDTYSPEWVRRAIAEAAKMNARSMKYIEGVLKGYNQRGGPDIGRSPVPATRSTAAQRTSKVDIDGVFERMTHGN